jgi:two-component system CheB/CheR fusion protein
VGLTIFKAIIGAPEGLIPARSAKWNLRAEFPVLFRVRTIGDAQEISSRNNCTMQPLTVFLVENHEDTARYMQLYLQHLNYTVCIAADMTTALGEIPKSRCDVLISDIGLPDGDGWQLMEKLGDDRPPFAIAMSGYGTGNDQRKSRAAGYNYHLVKPFTPDELLALLREADNMKGAEP